MAAPAPVDHGDGYHYKNIPHGVEERHRKYRILAMLAIGLSISAVIFGFSL